MKKLAGNRPGRLLKANAFLTKTSFSSSCNSVQQILLVFVKKLLRGKYYLQEKASCEYKEKANLDRFINWRNSPLNVSGKSLCEAQAATGA